MPIDASRAPVRAASDHPTHRLRACAVLLATAALGASRAHADEAPSPVRIELVCDDASRSPVCPTFMRGLIEETSVLAIAPQATAEVTLFVNTVPIGGADRVHLRLVGRAAGSLPQVDLDVDIDPRANDDAQRALLRRGLARGVARYVEPRFPEALEITLGPARANRGALSPWDFAIALSGSASHSRDFAFAAGGAAISVKRTTATTWQSLYVKADGYRSRWTDVDRAGVRSQTITTGTRALASARGAFALAPSWSLVGRAYAIHDRVDERTHRTMSGEAGLEWDAYGAADPRGNHLAVGYLVGGGIYDSTGFDAAYAAYHRLIAHGRVRIDRTSVGLRAIVAAELRHPTTDLELGLQSYVQVPLGPHVDLALLGWMYRELGDGPLPGAVFEAGLTGLHDEPLALEASLNLTFHWDRTNGARNDRFTVLD